ncbi:ribosome recycling factor [Candidatus Dependentiae bacterium]|jgi:ribosome recycling factor|nr:ribosome recycling factor [Candidatus Dependentiae bacterium]
MDEIAFQEGDSKSFEKLLASEMDKAVKHFEKELATIRTGRASTALIENLRVECYGQFMPLRELATLAAPEGRLLTIQPWDKSAISSIEAAIHNSDLGLTPANDGSIIRLQLPQMSASRREELVKLLGKKTEEARVAVRNVRKDFHNELREAEKKRLISEDFAKRLSVVMQKVTDQFIEKVDQTSDKKATEVNQI